MSHPHSHGGHGGRYIEEEQMEEPSLGWQLLGLAFTGVGHALTGIRYGWIPFCIVMGATSAYCGPSLKFKQMIG